MSAVFSAELLQIRGVYRVPVEQDDQQFATDKINNHGWIWRGRHINFFRGDQTLTIGSEELSP
jgi:hypothetical protein